MAENEHSGGAEKTKQRADGTVDIPMPVLMVIVLVAGLILGYFAAGMLQPKPVTTGTGQLVETGLTDEQVKASVARYLNELTSAQPDAGIAIDITGVSKENGMFKIAMDLRQNGAVAQQMSALVSPDGTMLFLYNPAYGIYVSYDMTQPIPTQPAPEAPQAAEVAKSDKPTVDLFVMSHCPYGTQMEKAFLPVLDTLGDKVDFNVRFVYYAMHGEKEVKEQLNQYCIQGEQNEKYVDYLGCFLKEGNGAACLSETGIDMAALATCTENADEEFGITANYQDQASWLSGVYPKFNTDLELNQQYGVGGSPTLIINGVDVSPARTPAAVLEAICGAFTTAPEECGTTLSSASLSPGFGFEAGTAGTSEAAVCS